jgi:hemoglobin-like flavoprotein
MTPEDIHTVQSTWVKLLPTKNTAAQLFCEKLLETDPSLRGLLRGDMRQHGVKLVQVIDAAVNALSRLERIRPLIQELGRRYAAYGVKHHHYRTVGVALLWTLDQLLGAEFTPTVEDAWVAVYGALARTMQEAAVATGITNTLPARECMPTGMA